MRKRRTVQEAQAAEREKDDHPDEPEPQHEPGQLCFIAYMAILVFTMILTRPKNPLQIALLMTGIIGILAASILHQGFEVIQE